MVLPIIEPAAAQDSAWIQLFNGKDLKDWDFKIRFQNLNVDPNETFKVVDGYLTVDYSKYRNFDTEPFGHAAYKLRPFSHYILRSEYRFHDAQVTGGPGWAKQNNGFMLHSQSMASMAKDQDFPVSMETQLLGPQNGASTMNLCTPGTHYHDMAGKLVTTHCVNAAAVTKPVSPAWTAVSVVMLGDSLVKHMVGRDTVFRYQKPVLDNMTPLKEGYIAIQAESAPVQFRKIELLNLVGCMDRSKPAYRPYFVRNDAAACSATAVAGPHGAAPEYRFQYRDGGVTVEGRGAFSVRVLGLDGTVLSEGRAEGSYRLPAAGPGLHLVRIAGPSGIRTAKLALP